MTVDDWRVRYDGLNAETDRLRAEVERLRADTINVHLKRAMLVVQRDAARAGEARAVEALRKLANEADALQIEECSIRELVGNTNWSCLRLRIDEARALDAQPALDWLAQQRAEAAAEVVNALADGCERAKRPILAQELRGHVAALLAGADALERMEAMESTSSTMLPKSASGSEAGE